MSQRNAKLRLLSFAGLLIVFGLNVQKSIDGTAPFQYFSETSSFFSIFPSFGSSEATTKARKTRRPFEADINETVNIRRWGCHLTATPFVFVHLGKAGGGSVRFRIATAAVNFTRPSRDWRVGSKDASFYPIREGKEENNDQTRFRKGKFCNSGYPHYVPVGQRQFEGIVHCNASTPIGQALVCPFHGLFCGGQANATDPAVSDMIYVGHNGLGTELHWMPAPKFVNWWHTNWALPEEQEKNDTITTSQWQTLDGMHIWCQGQPRPTTPGRPAKALVESCSKELHHGIDQSAINTLQHYMPLTSPKQRGQAWSAVYASLPTLRVTILREPFSWLMSSFAFSGMYDRLGLVCDNITQATFGSGHPNQFLGVDPHAHRAGYSIGTAAPGWARRTSLEIIYRLCGDDCRVRHLKQEAAFEEIIEQAEYNLRHAFAVVGILEEGQDTFFDMIHSRVDYLDMNPSNISGAGSKHATSNKGEYGRCKQRFKEKDFQEQFLNASVEVSALVHLYNVGREVHAFQKEELANCPSRPKYKQVDAS